MGLLKTVFNFYLNASIHVALAVYALVRVTGFTLNIPYSEAVAYSLFYGTIGTYNFLKYADGAYLYVFVNERRTKIIQGFSVACLIFSMYYLFQLKRESILFILLMGVLTLLYLLPVRNKTLRQLKGFKVTTVAVVWAGLTFFLPVIEANLVWGTLVWIEFLQRFTLVYALMLPFEIRDLYTDETSLKTLPQQLGLAKTKWLGFVLLTVFLIFEFLKPGIDDSILLPSLFVALLTALSVFFSAPKRHFYYTAFWVEGIPVFWWVSSILFR